LAVGLKRLKMERRDRMLATYLRGSSEMVLLLDMEGRVADANDAADRALGAAPGMLRGRSAAEFAREEASGRPFRSSGLVADGKSAQLSLRIHAADGRNFPCDATVTAIANPETGESACLVIARDVTERREREEALRANSEAQRHLNDQLRQANARLEEARQMQQQFLANTSHELRTPLNSVIGFATLLEQGSAESAEEVSSFANSIRSSSEHLLGLLNDILDLAKMESGRLDLDLARGDGREAVRAAVAAVGPDAGGKGLSLRVELPESDLSFPHDAARFRQVMLNLIGNAVKFTDRGEISVRAWRDDDRDEVCVVVTDTGIGIPLDRQSQLFTKFASREESYARRRPGTGLGLVISKGLVERMGGSIAVESDGANRGTRVRLTFPVAGAPAAEPADPARAGTPS
ncbi:MAG TPA: ATP-binding protein, partial [Candidatus Eisenbacteria bacterium]